MGFGGLSIALSSLKTHQRALELAANNVANANTAGYTRQAADMTTLGNSTVPAIWSQSTGDGSGVQISAITRFRNAFLEIQAGAQHASALAAAAFPAVYCQQCENQQSQCPKYVSDPRKTYEGKELKPNGLGFGAKPDALKMPYGCTIRRCN